MLRATSHTLIAVLGACAAAFAGAPDAESVLSRRAADRIAQEHLLGFHLFHDGRGMHSAPGLMDLYLQWRTAGDLRSNLIAMSMRDDMGMVIDRDNPPIGMFPVETRYGTVGAFGCAVCHCGKVVGQVVPGLGNKNIDPFALGRSGAQLQSVLGVFGGSRSGDSFAAEHESFRFLSKLSDEQLGNRTQGLVPTSIIWEWFFEQARQPMPADATPAAVKVPALWGFGAKRGVGSLCDGFGDYRDRSAWALMNELIGGQTPADVAQHLERLSELEARFADLLPPDYPLAIDKELARRGGEVFRKTCRRCHGDYERDDDGFPIFQPPIHVPIDVVDTDRDRLTITRLNLAGLIESSPIRDLIEVNPNYTPGYFAPRLEGIWARFPYLHNASVPNIAVLLQPPNERPQLFDLAAAGEEHRFDDQALGLTLPVAGSAEEMELQERAAKNARSVYDTHRVGQSNAGHGFGTKLSKADKRALIEYLKTL